MSDRRLRLGWVGVLVVLGAVWTSCAYPAATTQPSGPRLVMIIRHAEKPDETAGVKDPNLSKRGYERADALAKVMPEHFPRPDFLIATKRSKGSNRPVETLTPLARAIGESIDSRFKKDEFRDVVRAVLSETKYAGKVVLIAWHHEEIPDLAKALGAKDAPKDWGDGVFDRVWEISYEGGAATFKDVGENALPGDSK